MNDFLFKFVIVGDKNVGKSTLIKNYTRTVVPTIGVDFVSAELLLNNKRIKLHLWDTSGNLCFLNVIKVYFQNSIGCIIVFSLNNIDSFNNIDFWMQQIRNENKNYIKIFLIGTFSDKEIKVPESLINEKCQYYGFEYFQINEKNEIQNVLLKMSSKILKDYLTKPYIFSHLEGFRNNNPQLPINNDYMNFDYPENNNNYCCKLNCSIC